VSILRRRTHTGTVEVGLATDPITFKEKCPHVHPEGPAREGVAS
jgi:hypothetical protein